MTKRLKWHEKHGRQVKNDEQSEISMANFGKTIDYVKEYFDERG